MTSGRYRGRVWNRDTRSEQVSPFEFNTSEMALEWAKDLKSKLVAQGLNGDALFPQSQTSVTDKISYEAQ